MTAFSKPGAVFGTTSAHDTDGWWHRANCKDANPAEFEYPGKRADAHQLRAVAATYCNPCPVRDECLRDALAKDEQYGIRGGIDMAARGDSGVHKDSTARQREARNQQMVTDLKKLADDGFSRDEAAIYLRTGGNHITRILRAAGQHDLLVRLEGNAKRIRLLPDTATPAEEEADELVIEVQHLIACGYDLPSAAAHLDRSTEALSVALRRRDRRDLLQQLRRTA